MPLEYHVPDLEAGDRVIVKCLDPEYGCGQIVSQYDAAYLIVKIDGSRYYVETRLPLMPDPVLLERGDLTKTDRQPWWVSS